MSYGVKYRIEYKDCAGVDKKIDIEELDYAGARTDCEAAEDPFTIELPPPSNIFMPIYPTGATLTMISTANMMFQDLFSKNPKKLRVRAYAGGSANPFWTGYGNTEVHHEDYARLQDYDFSFYCNDGFAVLNRYKYLDALKAKYEGLETMWNMLVRILGKMELPFHYLYFACKLKYYGLTIAGSETLWHNLKLNQANYYDEQDLPMTHSQVLEAMLVPFGLQIRWMNGSILIFEPQMMADDSFSAKRFDSSFAYVDTVTVTIRNFDISNGDINWDNEDQGKDIIGGFNKQVLRYSPYPEVGAIPEIDVADRSLWDGTEAWTADFYDILRLTPTERGIKGITLENLQVTLGGHKQNEDSTEEIYITRNYWSQNSLWFSIPGFHVANTPDRFLAITGEIYIRTKLNEFSDDENSTIANYIHLPITIEIDGYRLILVDIGGGESELQWVQGTSQLPVYLNLYKDSKDTTICDKWIPFCFKIPTNDIPSGIAVLKLWDPSVYATGMVLLDTDDHMRQARFRDIKVGCYKSESTDKNMLEIKDEDIKYTGNLDDEFENEAPEITLLQSDAVNMIDRGGISKLDGSFTTIWRKTDDVTSYRIADILLRSIISQYRESLTQLTGTLEADALMEANEGPDFLFNLQDTDNLDSRKLLFMGGTYSDFNRTLNGNYMEIKTEDLTINIE